MPRMRTPAASASPKKPAQKPRITTRKAGAGRTMTSDTDQANDDIDTMVRGDSMVDGEISAAVRHPGRHGRRVTAADGKRKRSSRIVLDEDDTESDSATNDPATSALASGAGAPQLGPQDDLHRISAKPPGSTKRTCIHQHPRLPFNTLPRYQSRGNRRGRTQ